MTPPLGHPFFSILVPSYNRPEEITRNIEAILADSFKDVEIIISDDCSPRQAEISAVISPYLKLNNVKYYKQTRNLREPNNKNFLISKARGKYNIMLGDDDRLCPNALSTLHDYIKKYPHFDFYGFGYHVVDENDRTIVSHRTRKLLEISGENWKGVKEVFNADILPLWIFHPATFCCKQGVELRLPYQTDVGMAEDMWFMFDLLFNNFKMLIIPEWIFYWQKIQERNTKKQMNQSLLLHANFNARKLIYNKLLKSDVSGIRDLMTYLKSESYRRRFLYDPLISSYKLNNVDFSELDLCPEYKKELLQYTEGKTNRTMRYKNYFKRSYHFINLIGLIGGLNIIFSVLLQRASYQVRSKFLPKKNHPSNKNTLLRF